MNDEQPVTKSDILTTAAFMADPDADIRDLPDEILITIDRTLKKLFTHEKQHNEQGGNT